MRIPTRLPLTFQQQWLWGLLQIQNDWGCVVSYGFSLKGILQIECLERSLETIIWRHQSLRARIVAVDGTVAQEIDPPQTYALECATVPGSSEDEIRFNARKSLVAFSELPADVYTGPLFRARLLKLWEREHWLLLGVHRLVADCFALDQLMPEVWTAYEDLLQGRSCSLASNPPQYCNYAIRQYDGREQWALRHQEYWQRQLAGAQSVRWPPDTGTIGASRGSLGRMSILFGEDLSERLREFARSRRTLAANVMLSIYVTALSRHCNQKDFVVPCFVAGRQAEHKSVVGYFSHIVYVRIRLAGTETFAEILRYVGSEFFRALSHQDFGRMAIQVPELSSGTFFQWLTWPPEEAHKVPTSADPDACALAVERVSVAEFGEYLTALPPGMVDVELAFYDTSRGIYASGLYRADLFTRAAIDRFMVDLHSMAEACLQDPDTPGKLLSLATDFMGSCDDSRRMPD
jgi:hypothetical protein